MKLFPFQGKNAYCACFMNISPSTLIHVGVSVKHSLAVINMCICVCVCTHFCKITFHMAKHTEPRVFSWLEESQYRYQFVMVGM